MTKGRSSPQVTVEHVREVCDGCGLKLEPGEWGYCSLSCAIKHDPRFRVVPSTVTIELPWPPASLSGHNTGHWRKKSAIVAKHREWAKLATLAAGAVVPATGDIRVSLTFYPPDRRGDRTNYPNRCKPLLDGIADALKVNDRRFLPSYHFAEPVSNARVIVSIG